MRYHPQIIICQIHSFIQDFYSRFKFLSVKTLILSRVLSASKLLSLKITDFALGLIFVCILEDLQLADQNSTHMQKSKKLLICNGYSSLFEKKIIFCISHFTEQICQSFPGLCSGTASHLSVFQILTISSIPTVIWQNNIEIDASWIMKIYIKIVIFRKLAILIKPKMLILLI